jgi:RHS repeat-associated protein
VLLAQDVPNTDVLGTNDTGFPANGIFSGSAFGSVQINNGNLHIEIPVSEQNERGGKTAYKYVYNSKGWEFHQIALAQPTTGNIRPEDGNHPIFRFVRDSFGFQVAYKVGDSVQCGTFQGSPYFKRTYSGYTLIEPDGTKHPFPGKYDLATQICASTQPQTEILSSDGSGWILHIGFTNQDLFPVSALRKDGTVINFDTSGQGAQVNATDRNGNFVDAITDTLGRTVPPPGSYYDSTGALQNISVTNVSVPVQTALCNFRLASGADTSLCQEYNGSLSMPQTIKLPDGLTYQFTYAQNQYAQPTSVILPTGATISWEWNSADYGGPRVTARTITVGANSYRWTYNYGYVSGSKTWINSMIDPLGNETDYTCQYLTVGPPPTTLSTPERGCTIIKVEYYEGLAAPQNLIKTVTTDYVSTGAGAVLPIRETTTWNRQNLSSMVETDWDSSPTMGLVGGMGPFRWSNPIEKREFGYDGNLVRRTQYSYQHLEFSGYADANLADFLTLTTVYDGAGNPLAQTKNNYDEYNQNALTDSPGAPNHDYTNFGAANHVRANLTSVSRWRNTDGAWLTTINTYDDLGNLLSTTDPGSHKTTFNYSDSWSGASCVPAGFNTQAFVTEVKNALNQRTQTSYFSCNGFIQSKRDENDILAGRTGDAFVYDSMNRLLKATVADGGHTDFCYSDTVGANCYNGGVSFIVTKTQSAAPDPDIVTSTHYDGLGRVSQTTLDSDPEGADIVDTTYDGLGRVSTVSNPHRAIASLTDGITTTYYDALGRVVQIAPQDGTLLQPPTPASSCQPNNICTDYSALPAVIVKDQAGNPRRSISDALGRLVEVDEPGTPTLGHQAQGSLTVNGSVLGAVTVSISGADRHINAPDSPFPCPTSGCPQIYDSGSACININAVPYCAGYDQGINDTAAVMAGAIASAINSGSGNAYVTATPSVANVILASRSGVSLGSVSISFSAGSDDTADFPTGSYRGTVAAPVYDSGTVSATVNGFTGASVSYSSTQNASTAQVATALAATLNVAGSPVTAQPSGASLIINYNSPSSAGNTAVTVASTPRNPALFPQGSFSGNATLSGGQDRDPTGINHPFQTYYAYDTLGNLLQVNQLGDGSQPARVRTFTYDSLSRLLSATNPETGKITYTYDSDGNLLTKTAPAPNQTGSATLTTTFRYDALHRLTYESFSDGTYRGGFMYDEVGTTQFGNPVANGIGRLTSSWEAWGGQGFSYDALGRTTLVRRVVEHPADFLYTYNLDGSVKSLQYPSGRVVNYAYDTAGHALSATDSNGTEYVSGASYAPTGAVSQYVSGTSAGFGGISQSFLYNPRLQLCRITAWTTGSIPTSCNDAADHGNLIDRGYNFAFGTANNGNVLGITDYRHSSRSQSFTYDSLNRLASAQNAGTDCSEVLPDGHTKYWGNSYGYDPWGNLINKTITKCGAEHLEAQALPNNQLSGYGYDAAGNMTNDLTSGMQYHYDAGNMLKTVGSITYWYDNDGQRYIKWNNGVPVKSYFYGADGEILAEGSGGSTLTAEYIFFNGKRIARVDQPGNAVHYYLSDALNTTSMEVNSAGVIENESDYYPWGGELKFTANDPNNPYKFTGKERDTETGLDYFGARYYSNGLGRFSTGDWSLTPVPVPYADFTDPQSLNQYSYVRNIPTTKYDADGHCLWDLCAVETVVTIEVGVGLYEAATAVGIGFGAGVLSTNATGPNTTYTDGQQVVLPSGEVVTAQTPLSGNSSNVPPPPLAPGAPASSSQAGTVNTVSQAKDTAPLADRDPKRYFTPKESATLKDRAQGRCQTCGRKTTKSKPYRAGSKHSPREGQAGHKKAWSRGGRTKLSNGKWQCKGCNQKEGPNSK